MNVEKFIRTLGYVVYVALWSPVIVLIALVAPIVGLIVYMRIGLTFKDAVRALGCCVVNGIQHDMEFIRTGKWY